MIEGRIRRSAIVVVLGLATAFAACGDDEEETNGGGGDEPAAKTFVDTECASCLANECSAEISACQSDPGCATYIGCVNACPIDNNDVIDPACDLGCTPEDSSEATRAQAELYVCRNYGPGTTCTSCPDQVPSQPAETQEGTVCTQYPPPDPPNPCRECFWESCCETWNACYAPGVNPECDALATCIAECGAPFEDCAQACMDAHPSAIDTLFDHVECAIENCPFDAPDCDPALWENECQACVYGTCGPEYTALNAIPDGYLLNLCIRDCNTAPDNIACLEACFAGHPEGEYAGYVWAECIAYYCEADC
jgi:hypothetical protein